MSVYRIASQPNQISLNIEINRYDEVTAQHLKESFFICYEIASLSGEFQYWIWNALERWVSCPMKHTEESSDVYWTFTNCHPIPEHFLESRNYHKRVEEF